MGPFQKHEPDALENRMTKVHNALNAYMRMCADANHTAEELHAFEHFYCEISEIFEKDAADKVIEVLNRALKADYVAVRDLIRTRVRCSESLAHDPTIQVRQHKGQPFPTVSVLGLINGLFGAIKEGPKKGWGHVTMVVEEDDTIERFERTKNE